MQTGYYLGPEGSPRAQHFIPMQKQRVLVARYGYQLRNSPCRGDGYKEYQSEKKAVVVTSFHLRGPKMTNQPHIIFTEFNATQNMMYFRKLPKSGDTLHETARDQC